MAEVGIVISFVGLLVGLWAAFTAHISRQSANRAARASERSADAAERALELQRVEAEDERRERIRNQRCRVVPLRWEGRVRATQRGLILRNEGPGVAREVIAAISLAGDVFQAGVIATMAVNETSNLEGRSLSEYEPEPEESEDLPGEYPCAKVSWTNQDGSYGQTPWQYIERRD